MAEPSKVEFARRRRALMRLIGRDGIAIVPSAPVRQRNSDVEYNYRQGSDFYYLTGFNEPEAVAVLIPGRDLAEPLPSSGRFSGRRRTGVGPGLSGRRGRALTGRRPLVQNLVRVTPDSRP